MDEKNRADQYAGHINSRILPFIDYTELQASYASDMVYAKGILNRLHEAMVEIYGSERLEDDGGDGFVLIPGVVRGIDSGKMCVALLELDLSSSGEHWGTSFLCEYGVIGQDGIEKVSNNDAVLKAEITEIVSKYLPYDYCYTASVIGDIHINWNRLPEEIKDVLKDFHNHRAALLHEEDAADLYALGTNMMDSFDFVIKMEAVIPGFDSDGVQKILEYADSLGAEGSTVKGEYLRGIADGFDSAAQQYGQEVARKLLDLSPAVIADPAKIQDAAMLLHKVVEMEQLPQLLVSSKPVHDGSMEQKTYDLGFGFLGNGITVWNRAEERDGDYVTVAHISTEREVKVYDKDMPDSVKERIQAVAQSPDTWAFGIKSLPGMPDKTHAQDDKPSVLEKIREAEKKPKTPKEPKKAAPKRKKSEPEH